MPSVKQHIAKGFYQYSQLNSFISVKNYIFTRVNNKKCLLIRFSNDMEYAVNSMKFTVVQFNGSGKIIAKKKIVYDKMNFGAGTTYVSKDGIIVAEECRDFKIYFNCVKSGKYQYVVKNGEIIVHYDNKLPKTTKRSRTKSSHSNVSVKKIGVSGHRWSVIVAIIALVLILVFCLVNQLADYRDAEESELRSLPNTNNLTVLTDTLCEDTYSPSNPFKV